MKKYKKSKTAAPFNVERCADNIVHVLKKHGATYWDVDKALGTAKDKLFSKKVTHESVPGKYDGEIRIKTKVDNSDIDKTMKKLKKASALAEELAMAGKLK